MDDLVKRLREDADIHMMCECTYETREIEEDAADEIERLQKRLDDALGRIAELESDIVGWEIALVEAEKFRRRPLLP